MHIKRRCILYLNLLLSSTLTTTTFNTKKPHIFYYIYPFISIHIDPITLTMPSDSSINESDVLRTSSEVDHKQEYHVRHLATRSVTLFPSRAQVVRDIKDVPLEVTILAPIIAT